MFDFCANVLNISTVCKKLKRIVMGEGTHDLTEDWLSFGAIIQQLEHLEEIVLGVTSLRFIPNSNGLAANGLHCDLCST